jgi:hypothetical protein
MNSGLTKSILREAKNIIRRRVSYHPNFRCIMRLCSLIFQHASYFMVLLLSTYTRCSQHPTTIVSIRLLSLEATYCHHTTAYCRYEDAYCRILPPYAP